MRKESQVFLRSRFGRCWSEGWKETERRKTVSGSCWEAVLPEPRSLSPRRTVSVRRQLLLYQPQAAPPTSPLLCTCQPTADWEAPPSGLGDITAPSGNSHALRTGAHPGSTLAGWPFCPDQGSPQNCRWLQAKEAPNSLLERARCPRPLGNRVLLGGGWVWAQ